MALLQNAPTTSAFGLVRSGVGNLWMAAGWIAPFAVIGVAYLFPELRNTVSMTMPDNLFHGLFVSLLVAGAWVAMDWIVASYRNTRRVSCRLTPSTTSSCLRFFQGSVAGCSDGKLLPGG
jgi:hypothetical protein